MRILAKVKAGARKNLVEKITDNNYKIWVTQPPEKGKANKTVIKILAKYFEISSSQIAIVSGKTSSSKIIEVIMS